ncbi:MAG: flippase-like domain-containing protein, partial [Vampirovibrionia bacterium]
ILFFHNSTILLEICITTGLIFVTGFILIVIVSRSNKTQSTRINKIISILPKKIRNTLETMINAFIKGFKVIHSTKALVIIILTSIAAWFLEWATMYLIVSGFTLNNTVSPLTVAFLVVLVAFSTMIPSGPAFVGPYQYAFILALDLSSITKDASLAVAVTTQFIMVAPVVIIGMLLLWHSHFSMKDINEKENTIEETPDIEVQQ